MAIVEYGDLYFYTSWNARTSWNFTSTPDCWTESWYAIVEYGDRTPLEPEMYAAVLRAKDHTAEIGWRCNHKKFCPRTIAPTPQTMKTEGRRAGRKAKIIRNWPKGQLHLWADLEQGKILREDWWLRSW
jgi:hypothetical protein